MIKQHINSKRSVAKLMTNIEFFYFEFLENESKEKRVSKRKIIENAFDIYIKDKMKKQYEQMWKDEEYMEEMIWNSKYLSYL